MGFARPALCSYTTCWDTTRVEITDLCASPDAATSGSVGDDARFDPWRGDPQGIAIPKWTVFAFCSRSWIGDYQKDFGRMLKQCQPRLVDLA
jgi:hypothetical protein